MLNWLKRKGQIAAVDAATKDIQRIIQSLRGNSAEEIAFLVAMATLVRLNLEKIDRLPKGSLDIRTSDLPEFVNVQLNINHMIREFQKVGQPSDAAAAMVWLHSLRALNYSEVRYLGKQMWLLLSQGFDGAADAARNICNITGAKCPPDIDVQVKFIPEGLETK